MKRILKNLEFLVLIIPISIAAFQIYYSKSDTLSAWRGGGFGMYTEPHPVNYRIAFIVNENGSSTNNWIRIYPFDSRLEGLKNEDYLRKIKGLSSIVSQNITFPTRIDLEELKIRMRMIKLDLADIENDLLFYPEDTVSLQVMEIGLSGDFGALEQALLYEKRLCLID